MNDVHAYFVSAFNKLDARLSLVSSRTPPLNPITDLTQHSRHIAFISHDFQELAKNSN